MRWGIFGGSFDPVHLGHLRCAEEVRELMRLDRIFFVPAGIPPHKPVEELTPFSHRYEMLKRAISGHPFFEVSDEEGKRMGVSYTVDTIDAWRKRYPEGPDLFFITGQDAFEDIRTWKEWERLIFSCNFVVMNRPGFTDLDLNRVLTPTVAARFNLQAEGNCYLGPQGYGIYLVRVTFLDIKARAIRQRIREGRSIAYLTPDSVIGYIEDNKLYKGG